MVNAIMFNFMLKKINEPLLNLQHIYFSEGATLEHLFHLTFVCFDQDE